ncbi:hypothetical protein DSUL_120007 [Desulfovibrionales bacterium]
MFLSICIGLSIFCYNTKEHTEYLGVFILYLIVLATSGTEDISGIKLCCGFSAESCTFSSAKT